ncbi:DUF3147 family protein [Candidatus Parcubacteria bacterium]|nr:DUF3147 family protein [Candidatus Parcubacteria bacterium]
MITQIFLLQVVLSFFVGGLYIAGMVRISEKFGSKIGGLLIGLPAMVLVSLVFIAITQDKSALLEAIQIMPATVAAGSIFLMVFILLFRYGPLLAYLGAIFVWLSLNLPLVFFEVKEFFWALLIGIVLLIISMGYFHRLPHMKLPSLHIKNSELLLRFFFAGGLVALAVFMAEVANPLWGGLLASFPVAFSSTVIIVTRTHGKKFLSSLSRSMVNAGIANVVFVVGIFIFVPIFGVPLGIVLGYLFCLVSAAISYYYIMSKL